MSPKGKTEELMDLPAIAALMGVKPRTANAWRDRGVLPEPEFKLSGRPGWRRSTIEAWARSRPGARGAATLAEPEAAKA